MVQYFYVLQGNAPYFNLADLHQTITLALKSGRIAPPIAPDDNQQMALRVQSRRMAVALSRSCWQPDQDQLRALDLPRGMHERRGKERLPGSPGAAYASEAKCEVCNRVDGSIAAGQAYSS